MNPKMTIAGEPYFPCMMCVLGWRGIFKNAISPYCGTRETTKCWIAKNFLKREK